MGPGTIWRPGKPCPAKKKKKKKKQPLSLKTLICCDGGQIQVSGPGPGASWREIKRAREARNVSLCCCAVPGQYLSDRRKMFPVYGRFVVFSQIRLTESLIDHRSCHAPDIPLARGHECMLSYGAKELLRSCAHCEQRKRVQFLPRQIDPLMSRLGYRLPV